MKKPQFSPPHPNVDPAIHKDTERCVFSILVKSGGELFDNFTLPLDAFGVPGIRRAAMAAYSLYQKGEKIDQLTVAGELGVELAEIGGMPALSEFLNINAPKENFDSYLKYLKELMMRRRIREIGWRLQEGALNPKASPESVLTKALEDASTVDPTAETDNLLEQIADEWLATLDRFDEGKSIAGIQTGMKWLDDEWGGLCEGSFYAIGGRPGSGKTSLLEQMVANIINTQPGAEPTKVAVFQKDMGLKKYLGRLAARICCTPFWKLNKGLLHPIESNNFRKVFHAIKGFPIILANPVNLTGERLCASIRKYVRVDKVKVVFVDHMQVLDVGEDMREGLTRASIALRRTASETGVPIVVVAQLNRVKEGQRPGMGNIKEFDQLALDVDAMTLLWRENEGPSEDNEPSPTIASFVKSREGGNVDRRLMFDGERMCFSEADKE